MISGNCNRSPQYNTMGPPGGTQRYNTQSFMQQQQHPQLLFMAGGSVQAFPQMSRGFTMMHNRGSQPTVVQCSMPQGFGNYGYLAPMFYQQQPQIINHQHQPQPHYVPQQYIAPPPAVSHTEPTSGFINGIKNMVKGIIHPLNSDFYTDHHKNYNPKYRNNYMRDIKSNNLSCKPPNIPEPHVKLVMPESVKSTSNVDRKPHQSEYCPKNTAEVVAIFSSEDFPELPAPRKSRSVTPAKTETTIPKQIKVVKEEETPATNSCKHPPPKGTFFEIMCTTEPKGKRPTFGGRLKIVPPPFSLNKSPRSCRKREGSNTASSTNNEFCDIEEDSFVIFPNNERNGQCLLTSFTRPARQRQISECSDDSFVVFFTEDAECVSGLECVDYDDSDDEDEDDDSDDETSSEEEYSCDESDDDEDEDDDDGIDVVDSCFLGRHNKTDKNKCINEETVCSQRNPCDGVLAGELNQLDSGFAEKKVTFDPHPVVHVMHTWNFAYRAARKGHWEDVARDQSRFQERIERTSVYLNPVLTPEHREKIYHSRFSNDTTNQIQQQPNTKLVIGSLHQASANSSDDNLKLPKLTKLPDCASF